MKRRRFSKLLFLFVSVVCGYHVSGTLSDNVVPKQIQRQRESEAQDNFENQEDYPKALSDFAHHKNLVDVVGKYREQRLLSLDQFLDKAKSENVIILDSRSKMRFEKKHLKGAKNLVFSDYTEATLAQVIPSKDTTVLIYCNNNFMGDLVNFASKVVMPNPFGDDGADAEFLAKKKPFMLALNIPVFINLYGYGYKNVYELGELVPISDKRLQFEGSEVSSTVSTAATLKAMQKLASSLAF